MNKKVFFFALIAIVAILIGAVNITSAQENTSETRFVAPASGNVNVRANPNPSANNVVVVIYPGTQVKVVGYNTDKSWAQVEVIIDGDTHKGWVLAKTLNDVSAQATAVVPTSTPILVPTQETAATAAPTETAQPSNGWQLPFPPSYEKLPHDLAFDIFYQDPPENCAVKNDPNETCSTRRGQLTAGRTTLKAGMALVMTGDVIGLFAPDNPTPFGALPTAKEDKTLFPQVQKMADLRNVKLIVPRLSSKTRVQHDMYVVVNATTDKDLALVMVAMHGSFRGYFGLPIGTKWSAETVAHVRNLHLERFLLPVQNVNRFTPTPVPNCSPDDLWDKADYRGEGCGVVNVYLLVWDGSWHLVNYGAYVEKGDPYWIDFATELQAQAAKQ